MENSSCMWHSLMDVMDVGPTGQWSDHYFVSKSCGFYQYENIYLDIHKTFVCISLRLSCLIVRRKETSKFRKWPKTKKTCVSEIIYYRANQNVCMRVVILWREYLSAYCTVTAEKASKHNNNKRSRNCPQSGRFTVSSSTAMYLKQRKIL
jgi:hypothetical protein